MADEHLPKLKNKTYNDYRLDSAEWSLLGLIKEVLQVLISTVNCWTVLISVYLRNHVVLSQNFRLRPTQHCGRHYPLWTAFKTDGRSFRECLSSYLFVTHCWQVSVSWKSGWRKSNNVKHTSSVCVSSFSLSDYCMILTLSSPKPAGEAPLLSK